MADLNNEVRRLRRAGYQFNPTDQQLIEGYLVNMEDGNPPLSTDVVFKLDVYGDCEWMKRFEGCEEDTLYFLTKLKPRSNNGSRIRRVAANGTWKNQHPPRDIYDDDGEIIGSKSNFSFIPKEVVPEPSSKWVMHEYRLKGRYIDNLDALCRIRKKKGRNVSSAADANGNGRPADYGRPDEEDVNQLMRELENIVEGRGEGEEGRNVRTTADANGNGRAADYGRPDEEDVNQLMRELENIVEGRGEGEEGRNVRTTADANGNGRAADYDPPDDEDMSQMMMLPENIFEGEEWSIWAIDPNFF